MNALKPINTLIKHVYLPLSFLLFIWAFVFREGLITAVEIWQISEIFTHCYLILPCSFYFIYLKRHQLLSQPFIPNYYIAPFIIGTLLLQLFGALGDIQLFMHIATFTSLPLMLWMVVGNRAASVILFPLAMIIFAIPVGEQLIPFLQELTTDLAVPLLELSNVPIYRNGLYLDIPEGRFLVAEACSGISFLIASIVFGCIYAYISFRTFSKQFLFVMVSIGIPILANALRVYGIVLTGHLSDMEYAVGADHIIYGGVFYGIIIFILVVIGESFRDTAMIKKGAVNEYKLVPSQVISFRVLILVTLLFAGQTLWLHEVDSFEDKRVNIADSFINAQIWKSKFIQEENVAWKPKFEHADQTISGTLPEEKIDVFIAAFKANNQQGELISSLNRLYESERWTLVSPSTVFVNTLESSVMVHKIISPLGHKRIVASWYVIQYGDQQLNFSSRVKAKLFQTYTKLLGKDSVDGVIAFSFEVEQDEKQAIKKMQDFLSTQDQEIISSMNPLISP